LSLENSCSHCSVEGIDVGQEGCFEPVHSDSMVCWFCGTLSCCTPASLCLLHITATRTSQKMQPWAMRVTFCMTTLQMSS